MNSTTCAQVFDPFNTNRKILRDDAVEAALIINLKVQLKNKTIPRSQAIKQMGEHGLNESVLDSPLSVFYTFEAIDKALMFVFDGFHVFGEGHANLALVKLRDILSKSVRSSFSSQLWLDHHARRPEGPSLRDPLNSPKDWTGVEKEHFAINLANVLLPYFHPRGIYAPPGDPDESEQALASFFRQGTKDKPVRVKIGCNLLGVEYATARLGREDWAWSDWRAYFAQQKCPWRRFYTDYVVPLSDLLVPPAQASLYNDGLPEGRSHRVGSQGLHKWVPPRLWRGRHEPQAHLPQGRAHGRAGREGGGGPRATRTEAHESKNKDAKQDTQTNKKNIEPQFLAHANLMRAIGFALSGGVWPAIRFVRRVRRTDPLEVDVYQVSAGPLLIEMARKDPDLRDLNPYDSSVALSRGTSHIAVQNDPTLLFEHLRSEEAHLTLTKPYNDLAGRPFNFLAGAPPPSHPWGFRPPDSRMW